VTTPAPTSSISLQQEASVAVLRAAGVIRRNVAELLQGYDLTLSQYNVLRILRGSTEALPTMEIAARLVDEEPGITRLIDALERVDLLTRTRSDSDRRRVDCRITRKGFKTLAKIDGPIDELDSRLFGRITNKELKQIIRMMSRISAE